ncbi:iron ABC transporter permease [Paenibacillus phoenicis]|jgi:iron complex transport system permease protein|uniref:Iron ABC transporter permease n=1 Tax=Paenibacillus phoenicis TaxID=554117 RepID=A0ABU5PHX4_9BACL|nr:MULTISPECIES: iron ABC transporter permease [Paenibacillus]EES75278.1 putative iron(3+)-hydroxamate import system permease protein FhuB [Paenibacillus sp. oral taxon 786 str. D14]MCT2193993.1 iron ABC transporter permease [Paenibacillus sp. p3-SID1389]MEA3569485.1 iron ABC transporter permease [Paenibacillus phoenicis]
MKGLGLLICALVLAAAVICSISFGVTDIPFSTVWESFVHPNGSNEHLLVQTARVPRAFIAAAVGACLAVAGALMQVITRNPIASPSTLGVNSGAAFFIILASGWLGLSGIQALTWVALIGAALSGAVVFLLGSLGRDGMTPIKITLAGASMAAFFYSLTQGLMLSDGKMFDQVLVWLVGSVTGRGTEQLLNVLPYMGIGMVLALLLAGQLNVLAMGETVAQGLGQRTGLIKALAAAAVILLAGGSVAVAGPIAFVGIIIPHIIRHFVGADHRWILPYCALTGAILLVSADIGSRYIAMPKEIPVGVMTAILGVPFFVYIARRGVKN